MPSIKKNGISINIGIIDKILMDLLLVPLANKNENTPGTAETRLPIIIHAEMIRVCPSIRPAMANTSGSIIADIAKKSANLFLILSVPF